MKISPLAILLSLLTPALAFADNFTLTDGREYHDVTVTRVDQDGIVVMTQDGVEKLPFNLLPKEVQLVYPYKAPGAAPTPAPEVMPEATPTPEAKPATPAPTIAPAPVEQTEEQQDSRSEFRRGVILLMLGKALLAFLVLTTALAVAGCIAKRVVAAAAMRFRQREIDSANAAHFYGSYADFFSIWKLWNHYLDVAESDLAEHGSHEVPHASRWDLLARVHAAEGHLESLFLKLSSARKLLPEEVELLGRFRTAFQALGQAIHANKPLPWRDAEHPDYLVFKRLASSVALLISDEKVGLNTLDQRADAFRQITSARWERSWTSESAPADSRQRR